MKRRESVKLKESEESAKPKQIDIDLLYLQPAV